VYSVCVCMDLESRMCVCVVCVCVCVCVRERERKRCVCVRERKREAISVEQGRHKPTRQKWICKNYFFSSRSSYNSGIFIGAAPGGFTRGYTGDGDFYLS